MANEQVTVVTMDGTRFQIEYRFIELNKSKQKPERIRMAVPSVNGCTYCDRRRQGGKLFQYGHSMNGVNYWYKGLYCSVSCYDDDHEE